MAGREYSNQKKQNMITEAKNVAENFLSSLSYPTLSDAEIAAREAEVAAKKAREKAAQYMANANIPERHKDLREFSGEGWLKIQNRLHQRLGSGFIVALVGKRGTGKTQLAVATAKAAADAGKRPFYCTAMGFYIDIKETFRDKSGTEKAVIDRYAQPSLLIIDEVQERGETPWEDRLLTHLIDRRYGAQKDTLLISNQTRENFLLSVGESIASRIIETGGVAVCDWPSYRTV